MASYRMALSCWADPGKCRRICGVDSPGSILRFQVGFIFTISVFWGANLWIMNPNANSEAFYAGALTRISNSMIVLAVLFTGGSWILYGGGDWLRRPLGRGPRLRDFLLLLQGRRRVRGPRYPHSPAAIN